MRRLPTWALAPLLLLGACGGRADMQPHGVAGGGSGAGDGGSAVTSAGAGGDEPRGGSSGAATVGGGTSAGVGGTASGATSAGAGGVAVEAWPGGNEVTPADATDLFTDNVSGITYEPAANAAPAILWAVANIPGLLYRLVRQGDSFVKDATNGWAPGRLLRFPDGTGAADTEGVTLGATSTDGLYVASEHNNAAASTSRQSILRYDALQPGASLTATHEWNLTALLPPVAANAGIEAVTWVSDAYLVEKGFFDESTKQIYDPARYGEHGAGLFFVGVEQSGQIYGLVLDQGDGKATLVASIDSPFAGVMSLEHDREVGYLWFGCDDTCANKYGVLDVDTTPSSPSLGHFVARAIFDRPSTLPNSNHEGIAIGPESECIAGFKPFYWADDADIDGHTLRRDTIPCGPFL